MRRSEIKVAGRSDDMFKDEIKRRKDENRTMEKLLWTPSLSVGVAAFDEQHKSVILMINRLIDARHAGTKSETVSDLLSKMTVYAQQHLKAEEKMMVDYGYPQMAQHKAEHMDYIKKTANFCIATQIGVDGIPLSLLEYLRSWWEHHILVTDKAYMPFFNGIGIR
jgi:hemerythrin